MPLWGNTDTANNRPHFPQLREVVAVTSLTTANTTTAGNTIVATSNSNFSLLAVGQYVYSFDANNAVSRSAKDGSILDANEGSFWRSNNTITVIDTANSIIRLVNNVMGTLASGSVLPVGNGFAYHAGTYEATMANDVILVTSTRMANTQGVTAPLAGGGSTVANTKLGSVNQGWNRITRKINSDGTIRFLKETLVALASPTAANTQSANTSANAIFGGV
jgi:hypothetical protein